MEKGVYNMIVVYNRCNKSLAPELRIINKIISDIEKDIKENETKILKLKGEIKHNGRGNYY